MRLLQVQADGSFSLVSYEREHIPPYAILSHTWGADDEEVTFKDLRKHREKIKPGYRKLSFCRKQATNNGLQFFWIDTCCIDKSSSAELSEAINSMFQWYHKAARCYVYLSDVSTANLCQVDQSFRNSRWFTRGWTLQELLAPTSVEFFSYEGDRLGDRESLMLPITEVTGIPLEALQGNSLTRFGVDARMSWLGTRETKREEDAAYCLLGIFDVSMPAIYGEGRGKAFRRLEKEINESVHGHSSLQNPFREYLKRDHASLPFSEYPGLVEQLEISGLHSVYKDTAGHQEVHKNFNVAPYPANPMVRRNGRRSKARVDVVGTHDERVRKDQPSDNFPDGNLSHNCGLVDFNERTTIQLRNNFKTQNGESANKPNFREKHSKKNEVPFPRPTTDRLLGPLRHRGVFQDNTDLRPSHATLTGFATNFVMSSTELDEHIKDEQVAEYVGLQEAHSFLLSVKMVYDWLDLSTFNDRYNIAQFYDKQISSRLEDTCEWIFAHPAYAQWISEGHQHEATRILWVSASAGFGKTVLCAHVIERLKSRDSFPVAYFFASPHAQAGGEPSFVIRSWIAQVAESDSEVLKLIQECLRAGLRATESIVWSLFRYIVSSLYGYVFVLDGLDEYSRADNVRARFLRKLKEAIHQTTSRILILSRYETDIETELSPSRAEETGIVMLQCRITEKDVRSDISLFAMSVVDEKLSKKESHLRRDLAGQLTEKCGGMFLWIRLQRDQLRGDKNAKRLRSIVNDMPFGLHQTYERNWRTIQESYPEDRERALAILKWATYAFRPLLVAEVTEALVIEYNEKVATIQWDDLPDDIDEEYIKYGIVEICGGLIETRLEKPGDRPELRTIHLIHPSVRDFLLSTLPTNSLHIAPRYVGVDQTLGQIQPHEDLAMTCLHYLNRMDSWQRYGTQDDSGHKRGFIDYAASYWNLHLAAVGGNRTKSFPLIKEFLDSSNKNFGSWNTFIKNLAAKSKWTQENKKADATPLYYAALFDLPEAIEHILSQDLTQLNKAGDKYGTALQAACFKGHTAAFEFLLRCGANPNVEGGQFGVAINAAIAQGQRSMVKELVDKGVNYALKDVTGRTPLHTAARHGYDEFVRWFIEAGADQATASNNGWTPLHSAASNGHLEVVKLLLEKEANVTIASNNGSTPLHSAARNGHLKVAKLLLEKGADVAVANNDGWTPLNLAAGEGYLKVVELLLEKGADVTVANNTGWTSLNLAAGKGYLKVVELLLEKAADVTVANNDGWTSLNLAAGEGHLQVVELLLKKGADVTVANNNGWTPLNIAVYKGYLKVVELLLEKGADVTVANNNGWTPLNIAAGKGYLKVVELLLEKGADVTVANNNGWTPLNSAATNGHFEVIELLLNSGFDVNSSDAHHGSCLHLLVLKGSTDLLRSAFQQHNADVNVIDPHGRTLLHLAARRGHVDTFLYLSSLGLNPMVEDAKGDGLLSYASSGGSSDVLGEVLKDSHKSLPSSRHWTPLHWACRLGKADVVERLVDEGFRSECVAISEPEGSWNPLAIAIVHGNGNMLEELSASCKDALALGRSATQTIFKRHGGVWCNGCFHGIYGPRFRCRTCLDFDYCFMCKPFLAHLHNDHDWDRIEFDM